MNSSAAIARSLGNALDIMEEAFHPDDGELDLRYFPDGIGHVGDQHLIIYSKGDDRLQDKKQNYLIAERRFRLNVMPEELQQIAAKIIAVRDALASRGFSVKAGPEADYADGGYCVVGQKPVVVEELQANLSGLLEVLKSCKQTIVVACHTQDRKVLEHRGDSATELGDARLGNTGDIEAAITR